MSEHAHQAAFFEWASLQRFPGIELLHAVPNGGDRPKVTRTGKGGKEVTFSPEANRLKAEGVKAGVPDVLWPVPRGGFIGLAIEFKYGDGVPTKEQRERIDRMQRHGWLAVICWDWESAARVMVGYAGMLALHQAMGGLDMPK